jgi:two-component system cell cycle sensor histidine kinase/response regulator CckA
LLAVIEGGGELALSELDGHVAYEDVSDMVTAAKRAASLTRQLLAFSRRETAHPEPLDLADVVSGVEKMLRRLIGEHISFTTRLQQIKPIMADRGQLEQVLINLCVNARDAMPEGGTLSIGLSSRSVTEQDGGPATEAVALTVSDTGTGIEPELHDRIFEPFFTTKEVGKGTGLGLAMVYGIVTQNGGRISLESTLGQGTTFTIVFPVTDQERQSVRPSWAPTGHSGGATILLVEDAPSVRHITARVLRRQGYVVLEASRPSEARAVLERGEPVDLLLVDLVMPEMNGAKLAAELSELHPNLKVLFMTGYADPNLQQAHSEALARERVIQKPFTSDALVDRVRATLATRATPEG